MARLLSTWFNGFVGSARSTGNKVLNAFGKVVCEMQEYFASDFMGHGWKIFNSGSEESPEYTLEIDNVKVRKAFIAHELIIDQVRAICGSLGISQACGKVKEVSLRTDEHGNQYYLIKLEGEATHGYGGFVKNDLIRCQRVEVGSDGETKGIKGYWVKIESANMKEGWFTVMASEFVGEIKQEEESEFVESNDVPMNLPAAGDEIVQYGNTTDTSRQSAIYLHATEIGVPTIDLLNGINSKSFSGKIVASLGRIPDGGGFGLYLQNGTIISLNSNSGKYNYHFNENGSFSLGQGAIDYDPKTGVVTIGSEVVIKWGANSKSNVTYQIGSSGVNAPTGTWLNSVPPSEVGKYLWTRTKWPDGTYSYSVSYMAKDGTPGKDGEPGKDGADGQDMRPNLLDYTEFKQETFDNVPNPDKTFALEGTRDEGLDGHGAIKVETEQKVNVESLIKEIDVDFFQQNVKNQISPSTWYTLSFYLLGTIVERPVYTYLWTWDKNGLTMIDTTEKMIVDGKEQDTPKDGGVKFQPTYSWTRHTVTFKTSDNLPETCLCLFRVMKKFTQQIHPIIPCVYVTEPKLEVGKAASAWTRSDNDIVGIAVDKINMPSWVRQWDGQTTELGADYVAAKNAAFGTKDADGKFTGIAMSGEGFDLGGKDTNVVGLYGVSKDECRVIIDPKNEKYAFRGNIFCESGQVNGLLVGSYLKGLTQVTNDTEWDKAFTLKGSYYRPNFFVINPIVILSYDIGDKRTLSLPPYGNNANDYAESIAFLDYKFYIINKMSQVLNQNIIDIKAGVSGALYKKDSTMASGKSSISTYRLKTGKAVILTGCIEENGSFYWLVEEGSTSSDLGSGSIEKPSFTIKDNTNIGQMTWTKVPLTTGPSDNGTIKP
nr:MAG TPA: tail protein [Caudoviricetes sp.]